MMLCSFSLFSQSFEEMKKKRQQEMERMRQERNKGIQKMKKDVDDYIIAEKKKFKEYLKKEWKNFRVFQGLEKPTIPKPKTPPVVKPQEKREFTVPININVNPRVLLPDNTKFTAKDTMKLKRPLVKIKDEPIEDDEVPTEEKVKEKESPKDNKEDKNQVTENPDQKTNQAKEDISTKTPKSKSKGKQMGGDASSEIPNIGGDVPSAAGNPTGAGIVGAGAVGAVPALIPIQKNGKKSGFEFEFYGGLIYIPLKKEMKQNYRGPISNDGIASYWSKLIESNYGETILELIDVKDELQLNDWSFYLMVSKMTGKLFVNDDNSRELLTWFLLQQSGFKVKIGYSKNKICAMIPTKQTVYGYSYIKSNGVKYYVNNMPKTGIYTYEADLKESTRLLRVDFSEPLDLPVYNKTRNLSFEYKGSKHNIKIDYNQNLVDFYNNYPAVSFDKYFNAPVAKITAESLKKQLAPYLTGKTKEEQAQFLLSFIHKAFPYKTDGDQFGKEKYFFVEDIFSYPYCDCEDRSVLYSYLINELVGLRTIGVQTEKHMSTAVKFTKPIGDYLEYKGNSYTVCDPTYIGADIGMIMPGEESSINIIPVD